MMPRKRWSWQPNMGVFVPKFPTQEAYISGPIPIPLPSPLDTTNSLKMKECSKETRRARRRGEAAAKRGKTATNREDSPSEDKMLKGQVRSKRIIELKNKHIRLNVKRME
ncbi:uncharacterized protein LOC125209418 [Salvia hispanica]|uniref:uncharacterized protein LOC125209418 n=1 Tax=Salvia hispanica TaxID=49212 RepID=UPI0020094F5F|nr:uncharacterized protein LOC125209418 [Salvia hispanica]